MKNNKWAKMKNKFKFNKTEKIERKEKLISYINLQKIKCHSNKKIPMVF